MAIEKIIDHRENVLAELEKVIEFAKTHMKQGALVRLEHHWRDKDEREGVDPFMYTGLPADKVCIGTTIKISWDTMR